jgi:aminoglycoside phosphotransferase (APT) family kinase protein
MHAELLRFSKGSHGTLDLWRREDVVTQLAAELAGIQLGLAAWAQSTVDGRSPQIADLCGAIQQAGAAVGRETTLVRTLEAAREGLTRARAPALPQHGDCCRANLLWDNGSIRLLDWEHFGCVFEPFLDIWTFAVSLCEDSGDAQAASLFADGANASAAERAIRRYASRVGVSADVGRQVFPLALARRIHLNLTLGRKEVVQRSSRVLDAYLANGSSFMRGLQGQG